MKMGKGTSMKRTISIFCLCGLLSFGASAQTASAPVIAKILPQGFKSDGCTLFPDGDFRDCCQAHDLAYFAGGSVRERWRADNALMACVAKKKGWHHKLIAPIMRAGVLVGGAQFFPTPFRWGFGKKKNPAATPTRKNQDASDETPKK